MTATSDRWQRLMCAQKKLTNPFLLCRLVGLRARQLNEHRAGIRLPQAIDAALEEVEAGTLAPPVGWPKQPEGPPPAQRSKRTPRPRPAEEELARQPAAR